MCGLGTHNWLQTGHETTMAIADQQESSLASRKRSNCIQVQGSVARGLLLAHGLQSCTVQGELERRTEENTHSKD